MDNTFDINKTDIRIEVSEFRGKKRVDIRKWYEDKDTGELKRTTKGLNITFEEWDLFKNQIEEIDTFIKKEIV